MSNWGVIGILIVVMGLGLGTIAILLESWLMTERRATQRLTEKLDKAEKDTAEALRNLIAIEDRMEGLIAKAKVLSEAALQVEQKALAAVKDCQRIDLLESWAAKGAVKLCAEFDGSGTFVRIDPIGEVPKVVRACDSVRDGLDRLAAGRQP